MTITNQNAKIYRGDTAQFDVTLKTADGSLYSPSVGAEIKYRLSRNSHTPEAEALVSKDLVDGITVLDSIATIDLAADDTDLEPGLYYHELKIIDGLDVSTAMTGTVVIRKALDMTPPTP